MSPPSRSALLEVPDGQIYYEVRGAGDPILWVHARIADRRMWDREFARAARDHRVIRYDLRGHGLSSRVNAPYSHAEDLEALQRRLSTGPAIVVGSSLGGAIAIDHALEHPECVSGLLLVAPALSGYDATIDPESRPFLERHAARTTEMTAAWRSGRTAEAIASMARYWCPTLEGPTEGRLRAWIEENAEEVFTERGRSLNRPAAPLAAGRLASIRVPTTVLLGDRDEPSRGYLARFVARGIPGARYVTVPGADHLVNLSQPEAFDRAFDDLLARVESARSRRPSPEVGAVP